MEEVSGKAALIVCMTFVVAINIDGIKIPMFDLNRVAILPKN